MAPFRMLNKSLLNQFHAITSQIRLKSFINPLSISDFSATLHEVQDAKVLEAIERNIKERKGVGNIRRVADLKKQFDCEENEEKKGKLHDDLLSELKQIPNESHPNVESYKDHPFILRQASQFQPPFASKEFNKLAKDLRLLRTEALNALTGNRSYYFLDSLADLENALINFVIKNLLSNRFNLVSVPDILPAEVIERCGMTVKGDRSLVYFLDDRHGEDVCLSGTSEMALAGMIAGKTFEAHELPLRLAAVSRCFRSETSNVAEEKGIYRVHQFTKVEMFGICAPEDSDKLLAEFLELEQAQFEALELDFRVLDMPRHELGAPAYRKHDIEAWFPGRRGFGELSSCSNCTDYQARRLHVKIRSPTGENRLAHTVNGTACAIPRTIMALFETLQQPDGSIRIPDALQPFFGKKEIRKNAQIPDLHFKSKARR